MNRPVPTCRTTSNDCASCHAKLCLTHLGQLLQSCCHGNFELSTCSARSNAVESSCLSVYPDGLKAKDFHFCFNILSPDFAMTVTSIVLYCQTPSSANGSTTRKLSVLVNDRTYFVIVANDTSVESGCVLGVDGGGSGRSQGYLLGRFSRQRYVLAIYADESGSSLYSLITKHSPI